MFDLTWKEIAEGLGAAILFGLQWIILGAWAQINRRLGGLEESKASQVDLAALIEDLRSARAADEHDRSIARAAADKSRTDLHDKLGKVAVTVARLEGFLLPRRRRQDEHDENGVL